MNREEVIKFLRSKIPLKTVVIPDIPRAIIVEKPMYGFLVKALDDEGSRSDHEVLCFEGVPIYPLDEVLIIKENLSGKSFF